MKFKTTIVLVLFFMIKLLAQKEGDIIINEIGNGGTKKAMYTGGDYVELLILKPEGLKLAGWYLTDLSSPTGTAKETEGRIKFSDTEESIFNQLLPKGTYILICFGETGKNYGDMVQNEIIELKEGQNRIVVFSEGSSKHIEKTDGTISLTGKDNVALVSSWDKNSAVDLVTWEGSSTWTGCEATLLPVDLLENGEIVYFKPSGETFSNNSATQLWNSTADEKEATPVKVNKDVNDSFLKK